MSKHDWGFFTASFIVLGGVLVLFFMVAFVGLNYCPGEPCNYKRGENSGPIDYEYWVPFAAGPNTTSHFEPPDTGGEESYYKLKNLRAQESAARAAISMAKVGFFTFVLSILGAIFLGWNLIQTRQGNEINRNAAFSQTRAWLSVNVVLTNQRVVQDEKGMRFTASAVCENHGDSPALEVKFFAEMALQTGDGKGLEDRMAEYSKSKLGSNGYGEALFSGLQDPHSHELMLMYADIDAAIAGSDFKAIFPLVFGCVNYKIPGSDIVHQTMFGYHVSNIINGQAFVPMPTRHDWLEVPMQITRPGIVKAT